MPRRAPLTLRGRDLLTVAVLILVTAALPAAARADLVETEACDDAVLTQPFERWGDDAYYKLAPGGDAEGSLAGWSFRGGARRVAGSEPFAATGSLGALSLALPAGASVTTAATCVNAAYPSFRFFARSSGFLPLLRAELLYRDGAAGLVALPAGVVAGPSPWNPSPVMLTLSAVGAAVAGGEAPLAIRLTALTGSWQVDDVFVDPYKRG